MKPHRGNEAPPASRGSWARPGVRVDLASPCEHAGHVGSQGTRGPHGWEGSLRHIWGGPGLGTPRGRSWGGRDGRAQGGSLPHPAASRRVQVSSLLENTTRAGRTQKPPTISSPKPTHGYHFGLLPFSLFSVSVFFFFLRNLKLPLEQGCWLGRTLLGWSVLVGSGRFCSRGR